MSYLNADQERSLDTALQNALELGGFRFTNVPAGFSIAKLINDMAKDEAGVLPASFTVVSAGEYNAGASANILVKSYMADGASALGLVVDTNVAWVNATAKLLSLRNHGSEVLAVDLNGNLTAGAAALTGGMSVAALSTPVAGTHTTATTGGTLVPATYYYRISATNAIGETLASTESSKIVPAGTNTNTVTVKWGVVVGATGYKVYGRTTGAETLLSAVAGGSVLQFVDDGSLTPSGALPTRNSTGDIVGNLTGNADTVTGGVYTIGAQTIAGGKAGTVGVLTSASASIAIDLSVDNNFSHTLTESTTLAAPSNPVAGQSGVITFTQHASSPKTLAYNGFWKFAGGTIPTLTAVNSAVDVFTYYVISGSAAVCALIKGVA